jgi:regulator of nucleoside diphosphate kinase
MQNNLKPGQKPKIVIAQTEHARLVSFAENMAAQNPDAADDLLSELDRARVVNDDKVPHDVVRMGSTVQFQTDNGASRTVTLVYPGEADISVGKISVLTPIGTALLGLSTGQSINWTTRGGRQQELHILGLHAESLAVGREDNQTESAVAR